MNNGKKKLSGFADALIVSKSRSVASQRGEKLEAVYSFDKGVLNISDTLSP